MVIIKRCQNCMHVSLDGVWCHCHQREVTPNGKCEQYIAMDRDTEKICKAYKAERKNL